MKSKKMNRTVAMTVMLATALTLTACSGDNKEVEKEPVIASKEGIKTISKAEQRAIKLADKEYAERAWKMLTAEERLLVKGAPTVLPFVKTDDAQFKKALKLSKKQEKPLRVVYFKTHDEEQSGRLLVYGIGNKFVGKSERVQVTFANAKDVEKFVDNSKTIDELEKKFKEAHKWGNPIFSYQYASIKDERDAKSVADMVFYEIGTSYYAVAHKKGTILHSEKAEGVWTRAMIKERFGDVLPKPTN